jgi:hypothetical protein
VSYPKRIGPAHRAGPHFFFSSVTFAPAQGPASGPVADAMRNREGGPGLLRAAPPCSSQGHPSGAVLARLVEAARARPAIRGEED